jgi:TP901 family phage tail tape measure protein
MAGNNNSTTTFRADISRLKKAMQEASRQVRLAESEFKAASASMDDWSNSAEGLSGKLKSLDSVISAQKRQLDLLNDELEKTAKEYGENSAAADRVRIRINNQKAAIAKSEAEYSKYASKLQEVTGDTKKYEDALDDLKDKTEGASDGFTVMKGALASLVADGIRTAISGLKDLAKETYNAGANFEQAMAQVEAISGATGEEVDALTEKAKEMGSKTKFSASESAEAFNYMAMAGWKTKDMIEGIEGIMNLAAASGEDLATTSDIVTDALTAMGYEAGDAGKLADVMAAASSNANTNVALMGATFQYAAPIVGALGYNMEDTAVAIGMMANAGIKGEKAGTALRSILNRLSAPPKEAATAMDELGISLTDSKGKMKPFNQIIKDLRKSFSKLTETEKTATAKHLAGQEAMSGLLAIVNASEEDFGKLTDAVNESSGAAQSMSDTMNDTVQGQATLIKSQIEGIMIKIFEKVAPTIREAMDGASKALDKVDWDAVGDKVKGFFQKIMDGFKFIKENANTIKGLIAGMIAAFAVAKLVSIVSAIASMVSTFKTLTTALQAASTAQEVFNALQAASPIGLVTTALGLLVGGITAYTVATKNAKEPTVALSKEQEKAIEKIDEMHDSYTSLKDARDKSVQDVSSEFGYYSELKTELGNIVDENGKVKKGYEERAKFITTTLNDALGTEFEWNGKIIKNYQEEKKALDELLVSKKAQVMLQANEELYAEAIRNRADAFNQLNSAQSEYDKVAAESKKAQDELTAAQEAFNEAQQVAVETNAVSSLDPYLDKIEAAQEAVDEITEKEKKFKDALDDSKETYTGYITTIQNYEGTSAAVISGDVDEINESLLKLQYGFKDATTATTEELGIQVLQYEKMLADYKKAIEDGTPGITQETVDQMQTMVDAAKEELDKMTNHGADAGESTGKEFADSIENQKNQAKTSGKAVGDEAIKGLDSVDASSSGKNFVAGYKKGIDDEKPTIFWSGKALGALATQGLKAGQKEGSPSKITKQSGEYFGEGYRLGIESTKKAVKDTASNVATSAIDTLKKTQQEGSPSKLTYKSGVNFTKGFIQGISSMQTSLVKTVKSLVTVATNEALKLDNFNFDEVAMNASEKVADAITKKVDYFSNKMAYQNEQKLATFDKAIEKLEKQKDSATTKLENASDKKIDALETKRDKAKDKKEKERLKKQIDAEKKAVKKQVSATEKQYDKLIAEQNKFKNAYSDASKEMMAEFNDALSEYQSKAQSLIDSTIQGISDKYQAKYDELIGKQDALISKLKSAGELFNISDAGVITISDIKQQTKDIKDYTSKLQKIKNKVSDDLFDEIASYDMEQGNAFMDQLLALSDSDLKAYSDAYDEKMKVAESLAKNLYKNDFKDIADDYSTELKKAMKGLPKQLESLGDQTMKGFINGLKGNTDYMNKSVKSLINGMIKTFKKELGIHSPSTVMMGIGEYTGEGFADGLKNMVGYVTKSANSLIDATSQSLSGITSNIGNLKANVGTSGSGIGGNTNVVNNYNLVQNNTSPKSLSALETYKARRQQIAMVKAATQSV